jgi:tetratricopeptide (TPR) repeat protein
MWGVRERTNSAASAWRRGGPSSALQAGFLPTILAAWIGLTVVWCGDACAQSEPPQEAIALYRSGRAHYDAGRYRDAIVDLKAALALDPESPNLLYNVARVSELLGNLDEAIAYYTRYIGMLTDAENDERERIRATVRRLEGARTEVSTQASQQTETLREVVYVEPTPSGEADALFWVVGGSGVALIGGSVAFGVMALIREEAASKFVIGEDGSASNRQTLVNQADGFALASDLSLGVGLAAVTTATLLYFLRTPEGGEERHVQVSVGSDGHGGQLRVGGMF